jgi:uncharacterized coiled-coil DUF342 family protein
MVTTTGTRKEYLEKAKQQLDNWNSDIDNLEAQGNELTGEALQKYNHQVYELRQQLNSYQSKLNELAKSGQDNWDALREEVNHVSKTFVQSYNYFKSQL